MGYFANSSTAVAVFAVGQNAALGIFGEFEELKHFRDLRQIGTAFLIGFGQVETAAETIL